MSAASNNFRTLLQRIEFRRRWASLRKSFEGVSWFFVGTVFIFSLGAIFFILGIIFLAPSHSDDQTVGIIFLVIGIVGVLLGIVTFLIRCFCPRPNRARSARSQQIHHRHRGARVPSTNNRGGGERRNSQQRVWSSMPPLSASTPIDSSLNNRSIERTLSQAPPSYAEAINGGRKMRGIRLHSGCLHNYHHQRKSCGTIYSVPCSPPRSPPPSPVSRAQLNKELSSMTSINDTTCFDCTESPKKCPYFFHRLDHELQRLTTSSNMTSVMQIPVPSTCRRCSVGRFSVPISPTGSIPMSLHKASSLSRWFDSVPHSRGESTLELEAIAAVHQLSFAVQSISVSEMLPRTPDLIFINITTLEGQPYCLELTNKGWRITSLRSDCMQGDFTRMELFTKYYDSIYDLMEVISPNYKQRFTEKLEQRLRLLETEGDELVAPSSSYMTSPCFSNYSPKQTSSSSNSSTEDESSPAI